MYSAPITAAACHSSSLRILAISSIGRVAEPIFPFVAVAVNTLCPCFTYFASVPPHCDSTSSGCAPIASMLIMKTPYLIILYFQTKIMEFIVFIYHKDW